MRRYLVTLGLAVLALGACGENDSATSTAINQVLGIPDGTKEGTGLSGVFTTILEVTKNRCIKYPSLNVPAEKATIVLNVNVTQSNGSIMFEDIETTLRGGVDFDNSFEVGGATTVSREGESNILQVVKVVGEFKDPNNFEGRGSERLTGKILGQDADCTFDFTVKGIREGSEEDA